MDPDNTNHLGAWFNTTSAGGGADPMMEITTGGRWLPRLLIGLLTAVSLLGPCAAGVWLALHGDRRAAGMGVAFAVGMPIVWTFIAFWPSTVIAAPVLGRGRITNPVVVLLLTFLAAGWQYCVIATWTAGVCWYFSRLVHPGVELQMGALAYGVVLGPLSFMAGRDAGTESAPVLALVFALLAFATVVACYLVDAAVTTQITWLVILVLVAAGLNSTLSSRAAIRQHRAGIDRLNLEHTGVGRALHQAISRGS